MQRIKHGLTDKLYNHTNKRKIFFILLWLIISIDLAQSFIKIQCLLIKPFRKLGIGISENPIVHIFFVETVNIVLLKLGQSKDVQSNHV